MLYDLTSSYVEGTHCKLAQHGHSRDGKKGTLQIVFGLLCTATGCPVAVEVFEGSTSDPNTVASQVDKIRTRFGLHRVVLVGDRGMLTAARIREDLAERRRAALDHHAARTDHPQAAGGRNRHAVAVRRTRPRRGHQRGVPRRAPDRLPQSAARRRAAAQATRTAGRHREATRTHRGRHPAPQRPPARRSRHRRARRQGHQPLQGRQALRHHHHRRVVHVSAATKTRSPTNSNSTGSTSSVPTSNPNSSTPPRPCAPTRTCRRSSAPFGPSRPWT